jgi:hypothetical protein
LIERSINTPLRCLTTHLPLDACCFHPNACGQRSSVTGRILYVAHQSEAKAKKQSRTGFGGCRVVIDACERRVPSNYGAALDTMTRNVIQEIALQEEEACDVTLATFHVFDKEGAKAFRAGDRPITLGQGCCLFACLAGQAASQNNAYSPPAPRPIRPAHKHMQKRR